MPLVTIGNMSVTLITQKRPASNACTPELLKNKGKRFITLQEPDEDEKIKGCYEGIIRW